MNNFGINKSLSHQHFTINGGQSIEYDPMLTSPVQTAPFKEHPIVNYVAGEPAEFDIIAFGSDHAPDFIVSGKFSLQQYCTCLLHRLFLLDKSDIKPFIQYQCEQLTDPFVWLNKFEKLIDLNRDLYTTKDRVMKMEKALIVIELFRQEIQGNKFNLQNKYSFDKLKNRLKKYSLSEEQLICLYEAKTEYLQNKPKAIDPSEISFDAKIDIEIEKIERIEELKKRNSQRTIAYKNQPANGSKIVIRGHINILVDAFYQMLHEKKANGLPYLDANATNLVNLIVSNFVDKDGQPLSESTIRTMLSPNKPDKRPKGHNKIQL